ncbi:MAG: CDP-alcohol phosphatidyltransferase family protein [Proteobacteria bacterium]|nr:CDP-alcohol phosphatidyltransferase family protein [Pseudomonadota bacterium]
MTFSPDLAFSLGLLGLAGGLGLFYRVRVSLRGKARFDRTDKEGGSALVPKGMMEMAYWGLQPVGDFLIRLGLTPNGISYLSLIFGLFTAIALGKGLFGIAGFLAMISALMDTLDGMVARKLQVSSDSGEVLDAAIDRYVEFLFIAGLMEFFRGQKIAFWICALALLGSFMVSYSTAKAEALQVTPPRGMMRRTERAVYLTLGAVLTPVFRALTGLAIALPMILALLLVAGLSNYSAVQRLRAIAEAVKRR